MNLQYVFGGSGSGKTEICIKEMLELSSDKNNNLIYLVPEQFSLESEKILTEKAIDNAIMQIQVISFQRLSFHLFSKLGLKNNKNLDNIGKSMLIRKVISKVKAEFKYYKNTNITQGFIEKISNIITEMFKYSINIGELEQKAVNNTPLGLKIHDILLIYKSYTAFLENNYISTDETLDILAENIQKLEVLQNSYIWIDNFSGFTPQEYKVILKLFRIVKKLTVCLTVKSNVIYYDEIKNNDIFFEVKRSINKLTELARTEGVLINQPIYLKESLKFKDSKELDFIDKKYFSYDFPKYELENENVKTYKAENRYEEIEFVAKKILFLVRENNYRFFDIAILCADIKKYEHIVDHVFIDYNIPYFIDSRLDIISHPITEIIRSVVEIVVKNWSYESVFRFLKSGLVPIESEAIDSLENYVLAYGIKGYKWGFEEWKYGFTKDSYFNKEAIHNTKNQVIEYINYFAEDIDNKTELTIEEFSNKIFYLLEKLNVYKALEEMYAEAEASNDKALMRRHLGVWKAIGDVFDKMVDIFNDSKINIKEFYEILETGILSNDMGVIPPVMDRVIFGDVYRSKLPKIKALIVIGVLENEFPKIKRDDSLIMDEDRIKLTKLGFELAPDSTQSMFNDNFLIYSTITKPRDKLYLTYPESDLEGKTLFPSSLILRMESLFKDAMIRKTVETEITLPVPMLKEVAKSIGEISNNKKIDPISTNLIKWYEDNGDYSSFVKNIEKITKPTEEVLSKSTIESIYSEEINTSVSRLEKYTECPFAFFIQYNLALKERKMFKVGSLDLGNLFHDILEEFSKILFRESLNWSDLTEAEIENYTEQSFNIVINNFKSDVFLNDARSRYILERAKRIGKKSIWALSQHIKRGSFNPYGAEVDFGIKSPITGISIDINDKYKFKLTGRIDRIDLLDAEGKSYVKIIDYKSGNMKFDYTDVYYGMQLQLLLYMDSIIKNSKEILNVEKSVLPGGIFYFKINDPVLEYNDKIHEDINKQILETFKMSGLILNDSDVLYAIDNNIEKSSPVVSVSKNTKGEYNSRTGALAKGEDFKKIMDYSVNKAKEIGRHMIKGEIKPLPFKKGLITGCDYCRYKGICKFDPKESGYNILKKKGNIEEF